MRPLVGSTPRTLHGLLEATAADRPDNLALVDGPRSLTYGELDARAARVAHRLAELGVRRGDRVAIYMDKSIEAIVGLYGVLKVGGCYVPLDPTSPSSRLRMVVQDCGADVVLTGPLRAGSGSSGLFHESCQSIDLSGDWVAGAVPKTAPTDANRTGLDDLAYILYTSGSTGSPKGVTLTHGNGLSFVNWAVGEFALIAKDRMSSHAPLHFDLSIFDVFGAAASGAALVLVPKRASVFPVELAQFVQTARLTVWYSVPSVLTLLLRRGGLSDDGAFADLRLVLFAGEVFPSAQIRALMSVLPTARFVNLYGPTETNVCTWQEVLQPPATDEPVPIGRAIPGVAATAWTDDGRVAEVGEVGELVISGPTVMRGYWNDPKRTSEVLKRSPAGSEWAQAYLTGDLVRRLNDGVFAFIGRRDHQVKTRGYRVELGEVEAALRANPAVRDCAVVATPDYLVGSRLVACVVVEAPADARTLARACRELLPAYMVPDRFEIVDEMPRTATDKTDRRALVERYTN